MIKCRSVEKASALEASETFWEHSSLHIFSIPTSQSPIFSLGLV